MTESYSVFGGNAYASQCFSTALVESMIVPSISNSRPLKTILWGESEKSGLLDPMMNVVLCKVCLVGLT